MGLKEIIGLIALRNVATAVKNVCAVGATATTNVIGKEAWGQGAAIAGQIASAANYGLKAANGEFAAQQALDTAVIADEKDYADWIQAMLAPPAP
jgi:hypothetical protein